MKLFFIGFVTMVLVAPKLLCESREMVGESLTGYQIPKWKFAGAVPLSYVNLEPFSDQTRSFQI